MDPTLGHMRYGRVDISLIVALRVLIVQVPSDEAVSPAQAIQAGAQPIPTHG